SVQQIEDGVGASVVSVTLGDQDVDAGVPGDLVCREAVVPHAGVVLVVFHQVQTELCRGEGTGGGLIGVGRGSSSEEATGCGGQSVGETKQALETCVSVG